MMKFDGNVVLPNGAEYAFHVVTRIVVDTEEERLILSVSSWPSRASYQDRFPAVEQVVAIQGAEIPEMASMLGAVSTLLTVPVDSPLYGSVPSTDSADLEAVRQQVLRSITIWKDKANETFTHEGYLFASDLTAWRDITRTHGSVVATNTLPANWPGGWKKVDNTYFPIETVAEWMSFYAASVAAGTANFERSEALKLIANDENATVESLQAIHWDMSLPE